MDNLTEISGMSPESHRNRLKEQLQQLRQKEAVGKILYDQLLQAYNNLHREKGNRSNEISLLVQLHEQQKAKMRREMEEEIELRLSQYGQILDELNQAREARHQAESKQLLFQNLLESQRSENALRQQCSLMELQQLHNLNRQLKNNQQLTTNKMISQHVEEIQSLKNKHSLEMHSLQLHFQNILRINKDKFEQSLTSHQQQIQIQLQMNMALEESMGRLQNYLADLQQKYNSEKQELTNKVHNLEEANSDLIQQNLILNQSNYELRDTNRALELQNNDLRGSCRKMNEELDRERRRGEREIMKERSLSARLKKEVEVQEKQLKSRNSQQKKLINRQRQKEKQLIESLSGIKTKYERQHSQLMQKLLFRDKQKKQRKMQKTQSQQNIDLSLSMQNRNNEGSTCKMLPDLSEMPSTSKNQQSFMSTRHPTFQNNFKDEDTQTSRIEEPPTSRKRQVKHLRIHSDLQTVRQQDFKPDVRLNVDTPCFQASGGATASKPQRKINIRLKK